MANEKLASISAIETKLVQLVQTQQIHRSDFVELCLGLDSVKRALSEEREAVVTAKMLHEAFSKETEVPAWIHLSHEAVRRFDRMARYCNEQMDMQRECIAADEHLQEHFESGTAEELAPLEVESLVFLSRQEAERITRAFLQEVNGCVDEDEVARIMAEAGQEEQG